MIKYRLKCGSGCSFEGWFPSSVEFDRQSGGAELECPLCGSIEVDRAIMAPAILGGARSVERTAPQRFAALRETMADAARRARDYVEKNFDYVGDRFPEEARKVHYGEVKERRIYGEATPPEVKELVDEGIAVAPLPAPPDAPLVEKKKLN